MTVRVGVVGSGNIGLRHISILASGSVTGAKLGATVSRRDDAPADGVPHFTSLEDMLAADVVDAVIVASPTMLHTEMAQFVFNAGKHLLMEKPLAMSVGQAQAMIDAAPTGLAFGVMLNQRFHAAYARIKQLIDDGGLGRIKRFQWTMTAWYRPQVYFDASEWRGTWYGEGGGLLLNQGIHNLDVLYWMFGLPTRVTADVGFGRHHDIEVEDDVAAMMQYANGLSGVLVASSGEAPGVNRLEIVGDSGTLIYENDMLRLWASTEPLSEHSAQTKEMFGVPENSYREIEVIGRSDQHQSVIQDFVDAISGQGALATPAAQALGSLQLANAMLLSAWQDKAVSVPIDADEYEAALRERIDASRPRDVSDVEVEIDMSKSYR